MFIMQKQLNTLLVTTFVLLLTSCGDIIFGTTGSSLSRPASEVAQQCSSNNPFRADAEVTAQPGTLATEKEWVRRHMNEVYLWPKQISAVDASENIYSNDSPSGFYTSINAYFEALKTTQRTPSNKLLDKFSFTVPTRVFNDFIQSGTSFGYGIEWARINSDAPFRRWVITRVHPDTLAASSGVSRGDELETIDGVDFINGASKLEKETLNQALSPSEAKSHQFTLRAVNGTTKTVTLTAGRYSAPPVTSVATLANNSDSVGYIAFHDHNSAAITPLINAIKTLKTNNVNSLILDLRYNGGGLLSVASALSYAIAGPVRTANKFFEKTQYQAARVAKNNEAPIPFFVFQSNNQPIPTLNLSNVYVLTSAQTCSASESIINGLRGIGVTVYQIGSTTCGKPYGFLAQDNCGISYFPIQFGGINAAGFGDFSDGFSPVRSSFSDTRLPGCIVADDYSKALGDPNEGMLKAALNFRQSGHRTCPTPPANLSVRAQATGKLPTGAEITVPKSELVRQNKFLNR